MALLGRFRHIRYFRFGWERTLVDRMPDECKICIEVNPKVVLGKPISESARERARAPHDASSSSNFLASFRSSVSNPSVNQP